MKHVKHSKDAKTKARQRRTMSQQTYHVMRGKRRTTVMVDGFLSAMLALKLGVEPDSEEAHSTVRKYLQDKLDEAANPHLSRVSQFLQREILRELVDRNLSDKYLRWSLKGL